MNYPSIRIEGTILSPDILGRIEDLPGQKPTDFGLDSSAKVKDEIARAWADAQDYWRIFQRKLETLKLDSPATTETRQQWVVPLLGLLGYQTEYQARGTELNGKLYSISHRAINRAQAPVHIVGYREPAGLDRKPLSANVRMSAHAVVQEFINLNDQLYGLVTNGRVLRLLRDSSRLIKLSYLEFDLDRIFTDGLFADFAILYRLLHATRLPFTNDSAVESLIERYHLDSIEQGTRIREGLRAAVTEALEILGTGFLTHAANGALREQLDSSELEHAGFFGHLLRLVYCLLFLNVVEERGLIFPRGTPAAKLRIYFDCYSVQRLRRQARTRGLKTERHYDAWLSLLSTFQIFERPDQAMKLGTTAFGGQLFDPKSLGQLNGCLLSNAALFHALDRLCSFDDPKTKQRLPVNFGALATEEFGSVYESLLELHPVVETASVQRFSFKEIAGNDRKTSGSYYTHSSLVDCLLDSALDPVLDDQVDNYKTLGYQSPEAAILSLRVCDPACGSGHFLIAAAQRIARRLAFAHAGDEEPSPDQLRHALRQVISRCIYAVDINPMSVELCRVALWLEAVEPGKPLSFLDHHLRVGNSLLGTTSELIVAGLPEGAFTAIEGDDKKACSLLKKRNKAEHRGLGPLFAQQEAEADARLQQAAAAMEELPDDRPEEVQAKELAFRSHEQTEIYSHKKQLADAWCAAFVIHKYFHEPGRDSSARGITQGDLNGLADGKLLPADLGAEVERLSGEYQFFHWHLAFPEVFAKGGFDCVLGNPPWERVKLQEKEWFSTKSEQVMTAPNAAARKRAIAKIKAEDPVLYSEFLVAAREAEAESHLVRNGGRFRLCAQGDLNTYRLFAELFTQLLGKKGTGGIIVPTGIGTDDSNSDFFGYLIRERRLISLFDFENRERVLFPEVYYRMRFCLLTVGGSERSWDKPSFAFFALKVEDLTIPRQVFNLSKADISLINPNSNTCPIFRSELDAEIVKHIYHIIPVLLRESTESTTGNPWDLVFARSFHMTNDAELFVAEDFFDETWTEESNRFTQRNEEYLPLYEGRMIDNYDHRLASSRLKDIKLQRSGESITLTSAQKADPDCVARPRYWVSAANVEKASHRMFEQGWVLGCMSITSATNARTCVMSVVPKAGLGNSVIGLLSKADARHQCCLLANSCSLPFDYVCKQKVSGNNFNIFIIKQLPVLPPVAFDSASPWDSRVSLLEWIVPRVIELVYTANDLQSFAYDAGYNCEPFRWDDRRRFLLRCELDAAFIHLFGIDRASASHIIDAFTIVQTREEEQYGEYRTKRVIIETFDAMAESIRNGQPYQTRLEPPPGDTRCCHPPTEKTIAIQGEK